MSTCIPRRAVLAAGAAWTLSACVSQPDATSPQARSGGVLSDGASSSATAEGSASSTPSSSSVSKTSAPDLDHTSPDSLSVLVNKRHPIAPLSWAPSDLVSFSGHQLRAEAATAAEELFVAAAASGFTLVAVSGHRSYNAQVQTYNGWVAAQGQEMADTASARPGYSEHQTGLALDIGTGGSCDLQVCFRDTPEAAWLAENCSRFGFILRFPWMHHETTGYWYESWHFRYIGREQAAEFKRVQATTLEEFWGFEAAPDYL